MTADSASSDSTRVDVQPYCVAHVSASSSGTTRADERREPGPVEPPRRASRLHVRELEIDRRDRDGADRQIDPEARAPRPVVGEPAAQRRPEDRRHAPHGGEQALIAAAFGRREDVADDREQQAHHHARRRRPAARETESAGPCRRAAGTSACPRRRTAPRSRRTASRRAGRTACVRGCRTGSRRSAPTRVDVSRYAVATHG